MQLKCILYVPLLCICLSLFFGRVLTTLDYTISSAFIQLTSTRIKPLLLLRNLLNNKGALFLLFFFPVACFELEGFFLAESRHTSSITAT